MVNVTTLLVDAGPWSVPTSTRPPKRYSKPVTFGKVELVLNRAGNVQIRYEPVGPLNVPESVKPCASAIVGQPEAATTVAGGGGGGGGGGGAGGLLIVTPPLVPGEAISSAPQPDTIAAAAVAKMIPRNFGLSMQFLHNKKTISDEMSKKRSERIK